jgi:hypothetical protein
VARIDTNYIMNQYDYSLVDINPNSEMFGEAISPGLFEDQVTLHYFGKQY